MLRAVGDHLRLHALVRSVKRQLSDGEADRETLVRVSKLLTQHVRFEEQDLFPLVERLVAEEDLMELATAGRRDV